MHVLRLKLEDSILNFQILFNITNMELKMSQHIRRTCLRSVTPKVEDTALIWMLTSANNKTEVMSPGCLLFIYLGPHASVSAMTY